jgi:hypothetical protein
MMLRMGKGICGLLSGYLLTLVTKTLIASIVSSPFLLGLWLVVVGKTFAEAVETT